MTVKSPKTRAQPAKLPSTVNYLVYDWVKSPQRVRATRRR